MSNRHIDLLVIHRSENGHTGSELAQNEPGAYHLLVRKDGGLDWALASTGFDLGFELKGMHAVGYNYRSIGIAVYGCFDPAPEGQELHPPPLNLRPTQAQLNTLEALCIGLQWWLGHDVQLAGHTELIGATRDPLKVCPGRYLDMNVLRQKTGLYPPLSVQTH